ncbi:uncharacterized protein TNCT_108001 [Trichonephila clavata]|uniref:Uncharacterized protein n=1 Tax=Trichonephila clavata TaxID=2740835 RepID=A0A8X6LE18_TRICU|nr:uncharacterized protein TNCT_108001 [Trichonephila clavata]
MSKNKEIKHGLLNRLVKQKEDKEKEIKNPKRPPLEKLKTPEEIQKWIPSIKEDLEFYLYKAQVVHYSEDHIKLCRQKIQHLEGLYKAFIRKLTELTPEKLDAIPWTNRAYKRKRDGFKFKEVTLMWQADNLGRRTQNPLNFPIAY